MAGRTRPSHPEGRVPPGERLAGRLPASGRGAHRDVPVSLGARPGAVRADPPAHRARVYRPSNGMRAATLSISAALPMPRLYGEEGERRQPRVVPTAGRHVDPGRVVTGARGAVPPQHDRAERQPYHDTRRGVGHDLQVPRWACRAHRRGRPVAQPLGDGLAERRRDPGFWQPDGPGVDRRDGCRHGGGVWRRLGRRPCGPGHSGRPGYRAQRRHVPRLRPLGPSQGRPRAAARGALLRACPRAARRWRRRAAFSA